MFEFSPHLLIDVLTIILIDLLLAGDNAVVIALACRGLPPKQRMMGIILTLIVLVSAFNLVSTLVMTVTDKRADAYEQLVENAIGETCETANIGLTHGAADLLGDVKQRPHERVDRARVASLLAADTTVFERGRGHRLSVGRQPCRHPTDYRDFPLNQMLRGVSSDQRAWNARFSSGTRSRRSHEKPPSRSGLRPKWP